MSCGNRFELFRKLCPCIVGIDGRNDRALFRHARDRLVDELELVRARSSYGICKTMFRDARIDEVVDVDPCVLPKHTLSRQPRRARKPYGATAALALMSEPVRLDRQAWNALAFYTGMREGEVCGRRWRDWDPQCFPLRALTCATQYQNQPLKTEKHGGERPRVIPVHPELDRILREWWETGFELIFCRRPALDDFIVPHEKIGCHTKSSGYKAWRKSCAEASVGNLSLHSTRNTFITWARRGGARKEVLERVTNGTGARSARPWAAFGTRSSASP